MYKLLLPFFLIVIFSCKGVLVKPGFTIQTPGDWKRKDTVGSKGDKVIYLFSPTMNESMSIIGVHSFSINAHIKLLIAAIQKKCIFLKQQEKGEIAINHQLFKWVKYTAQYKISKIPVDQKIYFVQNGTYVFDITCTALKDSLPPMQPVINEVINSFHFK